MAGYADSHIDVVQILKNIDCSSLRKIVLVPITSATRVILKPFLLNEEVLLELSSHPGQSISAMFAEFSQDNNTNCGLYVEIGLGPKENAIRATYDGTSLTRVEDGAYLNVAFEIFQEGNGLTLKPKEHLKPKKSAGHKFIINREGSISPAVAPHLALGVTPYPNIRLVKRNSPNKAIFKHVPASHTRTPRDHQVPDEVELELISHPRCALVKMVNVWIEHWLFNFIPLRALPIGLGTGQKTLPLVLLANGQIISRPDAAGLRVVGDDLSAGAVLCLVKLSWYLTKKSRGQVFAINSDGSISPTEAPHLALGFYVLGRKQSDNA